MVVISEKQDAGIKWVSYLTPSWARLCDGDVDHAEVMVDYTNVSNMSSSNDTFYYELDHTSNINDKTSFRNLSSSAFFPVTPLAFQGVTMSSFSTGGPLFGCAAIRDQVEDDVLHDQVTTVTPRRFLDLPQETR
uniref:Uncharacterized protein n=1 Tax=Timema cristinae TaxID=61476 RepID=A0A7R9DFP3_TIMCR|nr:unnamed protein product [Timema cristinae]